MKDLLKDIAFAWRHRAILAEQLRELRQWASVAGRMVVIRYHEAEGVDQAIEAWKEKLN